MADEADEADEVDEDEADEVKLDWRMRLEQQSFSLNLLAGQHTKSINNSACQGQQQQQQI